MTEEIKLEDMFKTDIYLIPGPEFGNRGEVHNAIYGVPLALFPGTSDSTPAKAVSKGHPGGAFMFPDDDIRKFLDDGSYLLVDREGLLNGEAQGMYKLDQEAVDAFSRERIQAVEFEHKVAQWQKESEGMSPEQSRAYVKSKLDEHMKGNESYKKKR